MKICVILHLSQLNEIKKNRLKEGLLILRLAALYEELFFFYKLTGGGSLTGKDYEKSVLFVMPEAANKHKSQNSGGN